jgi:drug/metabolite transporter (DMT)-like permease
MIILVIFCNPISDLEFFFHLSQQSVGLLKFIHQEKLLSIHCLGLQMLISSLILLPLLVQLELGQFNVNSSNFMVVHCLLVIIGSIVFFAYIYMLQNLPAEINSIYAYINQLWQFC